MFHSIALLIAVCASDVRALWPVTDVRGAYVYATQLNGASVTARSWSPQDCAPTLVDDSADYAHARWFVAGFQHGDVTILLELEGSSEVASALEVRPAGATLWIKGDSFTTGGAGFSCTRQAAERGTSIRCLLELDEETRELDIALLPASGPAPGENDPAATGAVTLRRLLIEAG